MESDVEDLGRIGDDYNARIKTAMKSAMLTDTEDNFGFDAPSAPLDASDDSEEEDDQGYGEDAVVGTPGRFCTQCHANDVVLTGVLFFTF
jgi:hypothetical protein